MISKPERAPNAGVGPGSRKLHVGIVRGDKVRGAEEVLALRDAHTVLLSSCPSGLKGVQGVGVCQVFDACLPQGRARREALHRRA